MSYVMKEYDLRKWHRLVGIVPSLFILLQAGSGFLSSLEGIVATAPSHAHTNQSAISSEHEEDEGSRSAWDRILGFIHHEAGVLWDLYRVFIGAGIMWMTITGSMVFFRIRTRS